MGKDGTNEGVWVDGCVGVGGWVCVCGCVGEWVCVIGCVCVCITH